MKPDKIYIPWTPTKTLECASACLGQQILTCLRTEVQPRGCWWKPGSRCASLLPAGQRWYAGPIRPLPRAWNTEGRNYFCIFATVLQCWVPMKCFRKKSPELAKKSKMSLDKFREKVFICSLKMLLFRILHISNGMEKSWRVKLLLQELLIMNFK